MDTKHLTKMANEIAAFFESESGPEKAVTDVATHLRRFWDPRMRTAIVAYLGEGGEGLSEISRRAVSVLKQSAPPPAVDNNEP